MTWASAFTLVGIAWAFAFMVWAFAKADVASSRKYIEEADPTPGPTERQIGDNEDFEHLKREDCE